MDGSDKESQGVLDNDSQGSQSEEQVGELDVYRIGKEGTHLDGERPSNKDMDLNTVDYLADKVDVDRKPGSKALPKAKRLASKRRVSSLNRKF